MLDELAFCLPESACRRFYGRLSNLDGVCKEDEYAPTECSRNRDLLRPVAVSERILSVNQSVPPGKCDCCSVSRDVVHESFVGCSH